ncbi:MAG: glycosyltransferase family 4 protein [Bacteroidetes bacterium]|nr:glycosyltransferase family 4 protein [Bacteroidota bacterium]
MDNNIKKKYPRLLLVHMSMVKENDPVNLLLRMQFADWPKDKIAQIHAQAEINGFGEFCDKYYQLKSCDRLFGGLFDLLRGKVFKMVDAKKIKEFYGEENKIYVPNFTDRFKKYIGDLLIKSGVWEIIFNTRLSESMMAFIKDFKPDVIYTQGYSLGFVRLSMLISKGYNIPICFQTTDDWPNSLYNSSPVGWLVKKRANELIKFSKLRLAFGEKMREEYEKRYGVKFGLTYHLDNPQRFICKRTEDVKDKIKIIYTGGLGHRRYEAILDLLNVIRRNQFLKENAEIYVYTHSIPRELPKEILNSQKITYLPLPAHENLPLILSEASILFLPESFNEDRKAIEYSISTKAHLYMMSQKPILVYGPPYSGTVNYAMHNGWGFVVNERSEKKLIEELLNIFDKNKKNQKIQEARKCIKKNHDLVEGRKKIYEMLLSIKNNNNGACN